MTALVQRSGVNGLFGSPLGAGNTVLMAGTAFNSGTDITSSAPTINAVVIAAGQKLQEGNSPTPTSALVYEGIWSVPTGAGGGTQMGLSYASGGGATQNSLLAIEVSGLPASLTVTTDTGFGTGAGPADSGSVGPIAAGGGAIFAAAVAYAEALTPPGLPWATMAGNSTFDQIGWQFPAAGGGSYDFACALAAAGNFVAGIVAITPAGAVTVIPVPAIGESDRSSLRRLLIW